MIDDYLFVDSSVWLRLIIGWAYGNEGCWFMNYELLEVVDLPNEIQVSDY